MAANQVWGRHFGRALVETTSNLGRSGAAPSHPELLDWLACELIDSGWSLKHLHRLIVTSSAYRLSSQARDATPTALAADPQNRLLWRWSSPRLEAELIRDAVLHLSGELDLQLGGPDIDATQGMISRRRSLYFTQHGEGNIKLLEIFDGPNPVECYERGVRFTLVYLSDYGEWDSHNDLRKTFPIRSRVPASHRDWPAAQSARR